MQKIIVRPKGMNLMIVGRIRMEYIPNFCIAARHCNTVQEIHILGYTCKQNF